MWLPSQTRYAGCGICVTDRATGGLLALAERYPSFDVAGRAAALLRSQIGLGEPASFRSWYLTTGAGEITAGPVSEVAVFARRSGLTPKTKTAVRGAIRGARDAAYTATRLLDSTVEAALPVEPRVGTLLALIDETEKAAARMLAHAREARSFLTLGAR